MTDRCFGPEDLDDLLALADDDPRRRHLDGCPACRSLLASYRKYLDPGDLPSDARKDEAELALLSFIDERILGEEPAVDSGEHASFSLRRLLDSLRGPALAPALILIVALAVVTILWSTRDAMRPERRSGIVRDLPMEENASGALNPVAELREGTVELAWQAVEDADGYRIQILSVDLSTVREIDAGDALVASLEPAGDGEPRFWRVIALKHGSEIARSTLISLP